MAVAQNLVGMVDRMSDRFRPVVYATEDREDLRQEGMVGLLEAATRYEPSRGATLATYGSRRAEGAMLDHVRALARGTRERPTGVREPGPDVAPAFSVTPRTLESNVQVLRFADWVRRHLSDLGPAQCEAIRLRFFDDMSVREAATEAGVCPASMLRAERRAIASLREGYLASLRKN